MRADIAARLYSVEQTLAGVLVTLVDVPVLAKTTAAFCFPNQIVEVLSVENFHDFTVCKELKIAKSSKFNNYAECFMRLTTR